MTGIAGVPERVTVITLTRRRPLLVQRAIGSVQAQRTRHLIHHLVLVDDCPQTMRVLEPLLGRWPGTEVRYMPREPQEISGPGRSSLLRNYGARHSAGAWVAYLDDDNEWLDDHLDGLVECAHQNAVSAAYSYVRLLTRDGAPYLEPRWPWAHSEAEAERIYRDAVAKGVCTPGSNVFRYLPEMAGDSPDTSAWLLSRDLLLEVPFEEKFTSEDARDMVGEDDKLFRALKRRGEPMACTGRATLRYYLGGYSNDPGGKTDETFSWASAGPSESPPVGPHRSLRQTSAGARSGGGLSI
jgi:glycosyltransferase involved in cell wall biosynthesis